MIHIYILIQEVYNRTNEALKEELQHR